VEQETLPGDFENEIVLSPASSRREMVPAHAGCYELFKKRFTAVGSGA
jgi:hypothetical protein